MDSENQDLKAYLREREKQQSPEYMAWLARSMQNGSNGYVCTSPRNETGMPGLFGEILGFGL